MDYQIDIKSLKAKGRKVLKAHYRILIIVCLFAAFVGSEFADTLAIFNLEEHELAAIISLPAAVQEDWQAFFSTRNGVFASLINGFASGTIYHSLIEAINTILGSEIAGLIIVVVLALALAFIFWFWLSNVYSVISRRIFLESRIYQKIDPQRFMFLFHIKKWTNVAKVMLIKYVYNTLWYCVFIIGGIIKHYSYFAVPFILAENPAISAKQAIDLSRRMMDGHKMACFKLDLSYIGWYLLKLVTLGLSGLFYSNAYHITAQSELYSDLRTLAKQKQITDADLLNDIYLYQKADKGFLRQKYSDIVQILNEAKGDCFKPDTRLEKIIGFLGIALHRTKADEECEMDAVKLEHAQEFEQILAAEQYPSRLFSLDERGKNSKHEITNYKIKYTIPTLIMFFFIFSFIGWAWEVTLYLIQDGVFVNRGTMHGPWLPIYGSGGLLILTVLYTLRKKPLVQFFAAVVLCGIVEYFTSYILEIASGGIKWWNYSGYFLNLHGRICGEGLMVFGLGGIAVVYALAPLLAHQIAKIKHNILIIIATLLVAVFALDAIYSIQNPNTGAGITSEYIMNTYWQLSQEIE